MMKSPRPAAFLLALIAIALLPAVAAIVWNSFESPSSLARQIEGILPRGWSVEVANDRLTVQRREPVAFYNAINMVYMDAREYQDWLDGLPRDKLRLVLRVGSLLSKEELARWRAGRESRIRRAEELRASVSEFLGIRAPFPSTPEAKEKMALYENLSRGLLEEEVPAFRARRHTLWLAEEPPLNLAWVRKRVDGIEPWEAMGEITEVREKLSALFSSYPEPPKLP